MSKFKILILGLLTPLLSGVSFAFNPLNNFDNTPYNVRNSVGSLTYNIQSGKTYCVYFTDPSDEWGSVYISSQRQTTYSCNSTYFMSNNNTIGLVCFQACSNVSNFNFLYQSYNKSTVSYSLYEFDTPISVGGSCPTGQSCIDEDYVGRLENEVEACSDDILECQSDYNTLSGNYNTCLNTLNVKQGLLTTCESDLQSCQNGADTSCLQCEENLSGCLSDKTNLQNYNNSLSLQLNECLSNGGAGDLLSGDCQTFSLFWTIDNLPYSLPIKNNLFLPDGFQSYISGGVQAISKINKDQFTFDSFEDLYAGYDKIYLFLFGLPMFALFLYYVKTYFIYLFKKEK